MIPILHNLHVVVVEARNKGRPGIEADDAAFRQTAIFGAILADAAHGESNRPLARDVVPETAGDGIDAVHTCGEPTVGGVHDMRGAEVLGDARTFHPEIVVAAWAARALGNRLVRRRIGRRQPGPKLSHFLVGHELPVAEPP